MQETWVQSLGREDPLEKEMATCTTVFLPGKSHGQSCLVGSMVLQRVGHDLAIRQQHGKEALAFIKCIMRQGLC